MSYHKYEKKSFPIGAKYVEEVCRKCGTVTRRYKKGGRKYFSEDGTLTETVPPCLGIPHMVNSLEFTQLLTHKEVVDQLMAEIEDCKGCIRLLIGGHPKGIEIGERILKSYKHEHIHREHYEIHPNLPILGVGDQVLETGGRSI